MRAASSMMAMFVRSSSQFTDPGQIALAMTVGFLMGMLPTVSVPFCLLALTVFFIRLHLPILALTVGFTSFAAPLLTPSAGWIGLYSLTHPTLANFWQRLDRLPLVPWMSLHNTVVHGCIAAWLVAALPLYFTLRFCLRRMMPEAGLNEMLHAAGVDAEGAATESEVVMFQELRPRVGKDQAGIDEQIAPDVVFSSRDEVPEFAELEPPLGLSTSASSSEVIQRASDLAAWADDAITDLLRQESADSESISLATERQMREVTDPRLADPMPPDSGSIQSMDLCQADNLDDDERWLIETTMEVVRIAEQTVSQQAANKSKATTGSSMASNVNQLKRQEDQIVRREQSTQSELRVHSMPSSTSNESQPREEALQYLLRHLKGIQEKVKKL